MEVQHTVLKRLKREETMLICGLPVVSIFLFIFAAAVHVLPSMFVCLSPDYSHMFHLCLIVSAALFLF